MPEPEPTPTPDPSLLGGSPPVDPPKDPPVDPPKDPSLLADPPKDPPVDPPKDPGPVEYELKPPEGFEKLDDALAAEFTATAKEANLSNDQAQKLVDMYGKEVKAIQVKQQDEWDNTLKEWKDTAMKDEEIGGVKLTESVSNAKAALNTFGNTEMIQLLEDSGLANHPEMIRFLAKVGKSAKDDNFEFGKSGQDAPKTQASLMFPDMK